MGKKQTLPSARGARWAGVHLQKSATAKKNSKHVQVGEPIATDYDAGMYHLNQSKPGARDANGKELSDFKRGVHLAKGQEKMKKVHKNNQDYHAQKNQKPIGK